MNYATEMEKMNYESDIREKNRNLDCKLELCYCSALWNKLFKFQKLHV